MIDTIDADIDHRTAAGAHADAGGCRDDATCSAADQPARPRPSRGGSALIRRLLYGAQRRPHRQGARARRPRDRRLRGDLRRDRAAAGDVRGRRRQPTARAAPRRRTRSRPRGPTSSTATAQILATDVKTPSLFAEPRRIIDVDEAVELLTAVLPDLDPTEVRERLSSKQRLRLAEARDHAEAAAGNPPARHSRHRLPAREQARLSERRRRSSHLIGHRQHRQPGHRRHREVARRPTASPICICAGFATDRQQKPVELAVDLRVQHALRDELIKAQARSTRPRPRPASSPTSSTGEIVAMVSLPDYDPNNPKRGQRSRPHQPPDHRRVTRWARPSRR